MPYCDLPRPKMSTSENENAILDPNRSLRTYSIDSLHYHFFSRDYIFCLHLHVPHNTN